jgi:hypothetical protein
VPRLTREQVTRLSVAVLAALTVSLLVTLLSGSGAETATGRLGGDYPAFYAAGRIARDQGLDEVNDLDALADAQADLYPEDEAGDGFLTWAYPPHVALLYRPLAALPYRASFAVHTFLMIGLFVAAVYRARPMLPWLRTATLPAVAAGLAYYPMFRGIGSGQNTAATLLLLVCAWRASSEDRDGLAGVFLGLLLFKPQFALLSILLWVCARRWRAVPAFAGVAALTWLVTAWFAGAGWVSRYLDDLDTYRGTEHVNAANHVSLSEAAEAAFGVGRVGWVVAVVVLGAAALAWSRGRTDLTGPVAVLAPALLLCAAHAVFYDVGLVLLTAAVAVASPYARWVIPLWLLGFVDALKGPLGWNPNVLVLLAWFALGVVVAAEHRRAPQRVSTA